MYAAASLWYSLTLQIRYLTVYDVLSQELQRLIAHRVSLTAKSADELAAMRCAAMSCIGAILAALTAAQAPTQALARNKLPPAGALMASSLFHEALASSIMHTPCRLSREP